MKAWWEQPSLWELRTDELGEGAEHSLEAIVSISKESRASREIGDGGLWGRISGYPSGEKAINYAVEQFRKAGIADVRAQPIAQDARLRGSRRPNGGV